jgi:adenylate cyclase
MSKIFISYSSHERDQALSLVGHLRAHGYEAWFDQGKISGAMNWSSEIVEAINACSVVLFVISRHSAASHNCAKEIFLASEKGKHIIPIILEEVELPIIFEYPLAGLQRIPFADVESILSALERVQVEPAQTLQKAPLQLLSTPSDKIRLTVLPFDDLSASHDNDWFADGMTDELIDTLGSLKNLLVNPRNDVIFYKGKHPRIDEVAADLNTRYIVSGSVQKAGEKIRIRVSLSDAKEHAQIWSEKYDGTFDDIFDLQDKTARAISDALELKLTPEEQRKIDIRVTESTEAYEFFLKGVQHHRRASREDYEIAIQLYEAALEHDPNFAAAHLALANTYQGYYRTYSREPQWLQKAEAEANKALAIEGRTSEVISIMCLIKLKQGNTEEALVEAQEAVRLNPDNPLAHAAVGFAYKALGNWQEVRKAREQYARIRWNDTNAYFSLLVAIKELGDAEGLKKTAEQAIPIYEKYLRLNPDDYNAAVELVNVLTMASQRDLALQMANTLTHNESLDGPALYNLTCFFSTQGQSGIALDLFRKSIAKGYKDIETMRIDPDLLPLKACPEFETLLKQLEAHISVEATV